MEMIGRAGTFVDQIDKKQKDVMSQIEFESGRMNERVMEINVLKATVENVAASASSQFDPVIGNFKEFADAARAENSAGAGANKEAMAKAEEVRAQVNEFFEKTRTTFDIHEKSLAELNKGFNAEVVTLRQGVYDWSVKYADEVKQMVQSGNFSTNFDHKPAANLAKHDKKELSVWKLPDNVSKPDFRHWLDTVDIQLEAIHGFQYPDLVLERIKRLPNEVTGELLSQVITKINDEHREKKRKEHIEKTGAPSGISEHLRHRLGKVEGENLINPDSWNFDEKPRWMFTYLMSKLNTDLHTKTVSVENKNGL